MQSYGGANDGHARRAPTAPGRPRNYRAISARQQWLSFSTPQLFRLRDGLESILLRANRRRFKVGDSGCGT